MALPCPSRAALSLPAVPHRSCASVFTCLSLGLPHWAPGSRKQVFLHYCPHHWTWVSQAGRWRCVSQDWALHETGHCQAWSWPRACMCSPAPGPVFLVLRQGPRDSPVTPRAGQGKDEFRTWGRGPAGAAGGLLCFFVLQRTRARTHHLLSRFPEIPEQSGDIPVHLLPGAGVPPDHDRVPAQRVQGRGSRGSRRGPKGCSDPCQHPVMAGFTRTSCPLPFRGLRVLFPGLPGFGSLPPHQPSHPSCPLPPALRLQPHWPSAGPSTGRFVPTFAGGHTLVFSSIFQPEGSRIGRGGLLSLSCRLGVTK